MPPKGAELASEETIIKLRSPLKGPGSWGDEPLTEIVLKRPKGKHIKKLNLSSIDLESIMGIASKCSGIGLAVFDELDASDVMKIVNEVSGFLDSGPATGKTLS